MRIPAPVWRLALQGLGLLALVCAMPVPSARAIDWQESPQVAALFEDAGVTGTFVLHDVGADTFSGHDLARAERRFSPASTFKVANSLIGLAVGAVRSVDEALPYAGPAEPFIRAWARDMGLREAIALSNVPIYQELARRIGPEQMRAQLARLDYGNADTGGAVDSFWLDGPLRISALEQARFMARLAQGTLPLPESVQGAVRDIMRHDQKPGWSLHAKTGWENAPGPGVGWWVGWVAKAGRIYAFALNLDIRHAADADKRIPLGKASLAVLGLD